MSRNQKIDELVSLALPHPLRCKFREIRDQLKELLKWKEYIFSVNYENL